MNDSDTESAGESYVRRIGAGGFVVAFVVLLGIFGMDIWRSHESRKALEWVSHTHTVQTQLSKVLSTLQDAETGQRGYLLTGVESYLEPFKNANQKIHIVLDDLRTLTADNPRQQEELDRIGPLVHEKFNELIKTISLLKTEGLDIALALVQTDRGKIVMDQIRSHIANMEAEENALLAKRKDYALRLADLNLIVDGVGFIVIVLIAIFVIRRVSHNIAVRRRSEIALKQRSVELESANAELDASAHSISHDLRAPLRAMDGFRQALIADHGDKLEGEAKDFLDRISKASRRMGQMIDEILTLSLATRQKILTQEVDLTAIVQKLLAELIARNPDRSVTIEVAPNFTARGDPGLLQVVLDNLLGNAWKFTNQKEVGKIEFGMYSKDRERVYFVRDDGAGFDMAYEDKLFGIFQRLHSTTAFEGTGIGLATVARLIHRHGGRVWAEGEENKGASFYFTLER